MSNGVNFNLDKKLIELLDKHRGDLTRDDYISRILKEKFEVNEKIDFSKYDNSVADSELEPLDLDIGEFLDDFKKFADSIYSRLDRLEILLNNQNQIQRSIKTEDYSIGTKIDDDQIINPEKNQVDETVIFEIEDSEEQITKESEPRSKFKTSTADDEFEYGCPYCNSTISSDATECPNCGSRFDDSGSEAYHAMPVEPIPDYYSDSGEYDPRPGHHGINKKSNREDVEYSKPRTLERTSFESIDRKSCPNCSRKMDYIKDYKRWYCYYCKKYAYGSISSAEPEQHSFSDEPKPEFEPIPKRYTDRSSEVPRTRVYQGKKKPLKDYPKYR